MASNNLLRGTLDAQRVGSRIAGTPKTFAGIFVALAVLFITVVLSFSLGAKSIPPFEVAQALLGQGQENIVAIVGQLRLSRTVIGLISGCALGLAGTLMQAITRNPIADPGILGVNAGAALGVVVGILLTGALGVTSTMAFAMIGAAVAAGAVMVLSSSYAGASSPVRLTLSGVALAAILSGVTNAIVLTDESILDTFRFWQVGSLTSRPVAEAAMFLPIIIVGIVLALFLGGPLNALALGDDSAVALGSNPARIRLVGLLAVTILCGGATALAGPISFVGLLAPHLVRRFTGPDLRRLIPLAMLVAPIILLLSDILGRLIGGGSEVPVGIMCAFVGAPLLIVLLRRGRSRSIS